jgi:hypothetical protein
MNEIRRQQWEVEARRILEKEEVFPGVEGQLIDMFRLEGTPYSELEAKAKEWRELYPCLFMANVHEGIN